MANRSDLRQFVLFSFSRLRFFQNFRVFFGISPWPVVDVTKITRDDRRTSACRRHLLDSTHGTDNAGCMHKNQDQRTSLKLSISSTVV
jgi:hypothetical protein